MTDRRLFLFDSRPRGIDEQDDGEPVGERMEDIPGES